MNVSLWEHFENYLPRPEETGQVQIRNILKQAFHFLSEIDSRTEILTLSRSGGKDGMKWPLFANVLFTKMALPYDSI